MKIEVEVVLIVTVEADDATVAFAKTHEFLDTIPKNVKYKVGTILTEGVPGGEDFDDEPV